jgi:hypothetical protein
MPNKVIAYAEGRRSVTLGMSRFAALVLLGFVGAVAACGAGTAPAPDASVVGVDASLADVAEPRLDGSVDATTEALDAAPEDAGHADAGPADSGVPPTERIVPLFGPDTALEPALTEVTPTALITRFADRGRDRHAREDRFRAYEHYLPLYWEYRTVGVVIHDPIGRGGDTITFEVTTLWKLVNMQAELRLFYRGIGTVAEYHDNRPMTPLDNFHYRHQVSTNVPAGRPLQPGDRVEFEVSQFLDGVPRGRSAYYGTAYLYIVGQGLVPWIGSGARRDSEPIALSARLGGSTTVHANESNEPAYAFSQMATHLAPEHAQTFMRGRRLAHTSFVDGRHDESPDNPVWVEHAGKSGPLAITGACNDCHARNGRASPPEVGASLDQYVFRLGAADGGPDPRLGQVLQPRGGLEPAVRLTGWREARGLRRPEYGFQDPAPARSSARITPQLVGLGLLEAIPEASIVRLADPDDADGDGISGRASVVLETTTGLPRLGRFGYKAGQPTVRQQTAAALRTDMGVLTSVYPSPDCGASRRAAARPSPSCPTTSSTRSRCTWRSSGCRRSVASRTPMSWRGRPCSGPSAAMTATWARSRRPSGPSTRSSARRSYARSRISCCTTSVLSWPMSSGRATPPARSGGRRRCGAWGTPRPSRRRKATCTTGAPARWRRRFAGTGVRPRARARPSRLSTPPSARSCCGSSARCSGRRSRARPPSRLSSRPTGCRSACGTRPRSHTPGGAHRGWCRWS